MSMNAPHKKDEDAAACGFILGDNLKALPMGLWRKSIILRSAHVSDAQNMPNMPERTSFDGHFIRVPQSYDGFDEIQSQRLLKAAIAHIAAHLEYGHMCLQPKALKPVQIAIVSILEDTRVELLAARQYPGLMNLWREFHSIKANRAATTANLLARLARALIDPDFEDTHSWIQKGRELFFAAGFDDHGFEELRRIGVLLGNDLGQMRLQFNAKNYVVQPVYRDDNLGMWDFGDAPDEREDNLDTVIASMCVEQQQQDTEALQQQRQEPNQIDNGFKSHPSRQLDNEGIPICKLPEWDYTASVMLPNWVTLMEYKPLTAPSHIISGILDRYSSISDKISKLVQQSKIGQMQRLKRQKEGDRLDLDACISRQIDTRAGGNNDTGIYEKTAFAKRDLSVLVLLDVSQSTKDLINGTSVSIFHMERAATALLAQAMDGMGDAFAIHAFCSNGRHDLRYDRIKDFGAPYNDASKSKLAGLRPGFSTRMGGALRFAQQFISVQTTRRKLVLVVTDGEPSDIDVDDSQYLVEDSRKAVMEMAGQGIDVFAVGLGGAGSQYLPRIFGARNAIEIQNISQLPERLPMIYFRLAS